MILAPKVEARPSDFFAGDQRETVRKRLAAFVEAQLRHGLAALFQAREAPLSGTARGLAFQLGEALGSLQAKPASPLVASLASSDRKRLSLLGVRFGVESIYLEPLLKPEAIRLRGLLWALASGQPSAPVPKGNAAPRDPAISAAAYEAMGYRVLGSRVLRLDRVERLAARARALARQGAFAALPELALLPAAPPRICPGCSPVWAIDPPIRAARDYFPRPRAGAAQRRETGTARRAFRQAQGADPGAMSEPTIRLDKFLFHARLARTRSLGGAALQPGARSRSAAVLALKPHHPVRVGDLLTLERGAWLRRITVRALPRRRGGAAEARLYYDEIEPPVLRPAEPWIPLLDEEISETVPETVPETV